MEGYMTAAEFAREMKAIEEKYATSPKIKHEKMDELMIRVLKQYGMDAGCDIFAKTEKYYN